MSSFFAAISLGAALPSSIRLKCISNAANCRAEVSSEFAVMLVPEGDARIHASSHERGISAYVGELGGQDLEEAFLLRPDSSTRHDVSDSFLRSCVGTFALLDLDCKAFSAVVATDSLGVRNLYWAQQDNVVYVSTSFDRLVDLSLLRLTIDMRGVYEAVTFGYPLADRTVYSEIQCLPPAGVLRIVSGVVSVSSYRALASVEEIDTPIRESASRIAAEFERAVIIRAPGSHAILGLSGGMDSRFLAWTLKNLGVDVTAINVSPQRSQDREYAKRAAGAMGLRYVQFESTPGPANFPATLDRALSSPALAKAGGQTRNRVWSGDGGSVGLGCVLVFPEVLVPLARWDVRKAAEEYIRVARLGLPLRILNKELRDSASSWPTIAFMAEIERFDSLSDPRRALHLTLFANDQRRHCSKLWEQIEELKIDQTYPFYDARFVDAICATPVEQLVQHRVYHEILLRCNNANQTPWQTYPEHVPCPIEGDEALSYQWESSGGTYRQTHSSRVRQVAEVFSALRRGTIPSHLIDVPALTACCVAQAAGVRDCSNHLNLALLLVRLSERTGGAVGSAP